MKFFKARSYDIVRLFIMQIGMTIFGLVLTFATGMLDSTLTSAFTLGVSIFSTCFYLYLLYDAAWEMGSKEIISMQSGRVPMSRTNGLKMILFAEIPNAIVALMLWIGAVLLRFSGGVADAGSVIYMIALPIAEFGQAMYLGIVMRFFVKTGFVTNALCYTVTMIPAILVVWLGYILGQKDIRFLTGPAKRKKSE